MPITMPITKKTIWRLHKSLLLAFVAGLYVWASVGQAQIRTQQNLRISGQAQHQEIKSGDNIDFLVWNIHKAADENFARDFEELSLGKEIVMVQEAVYPNDFIDLLLSLGKYEWGMATSFRLIRKDLAGTGVATGSLIKSKKKDTLLTYITEPVVKTPKISLYSEYPITSGRHSGKTLLVANIHAINFVGDLSFLVEMKRIEGKINGHEGPMVLAGDFNTWTNFRNKVLQKLVKKLELRAIPFKDGERTTTFGHPLDHFFYRGLDYIEHENLSHIQTSDHLPMSVSLKLP